MRFPGRNREAETAAWRGAVWDMDSHAHKSTVGACVRHSCGFWWDCDLSHNVSLYMTQRAADRYHLAEHIVKIWATVETRGQGTKQPRDQRVSITPAQPRDEGRFSGEVGGSRGARNLKQKNAGSRSLPSGCKVVWLVPQNCNLPSKPKHSFPSKGATQELPVVNRRLTKDHISKKSGSFKILEASTIK